MDDPAALETKLKEVTAAATVLDKEAEELQRKINNVQRLVREIQKKLTIVSGARDKKNRLQAELLREESQYRWCKERLERTLEIVPPGEQNAPQAQVDLKLSRGEPINYWYVA